MLKHCLPLLALLSCLAANVDARQLAAHAPTAGATIRVAEQGISMSDAIERVRKQTGGRVLDAQQRNGKYRIKVLTPKGEVRVFQVDAQTGAVR